MRLYHTGTVVIPEPDIHYGRKNADFGQGFYLSPDRNFEYRWAPKNAFINEYELDLTGLDVLRFERSKEWFEYIFQNRRVNDTSSADVVIGPIANDTIYDTFGIISSGYLKPEDALSLLMIGPEYTQVVIKTKKARAQLTWLGAEKIHDRDAVQALLEKEEAAFQEAFAEKMQQIAK